MIEIYRFEPAWKVNASPFCLKVETYCQLAGIPYSVAFTQPVNGPRGLLPFIVDENKTIPDSSKIIKYLKEKYGDTLDANLSQEDHAKGYLLRQLCEQSLYFAILYSRWQDDDYWQEVYKELFGKIPPIARDVSSAMTRRKMVIALSAQGYGRLSKEEVYEMAAQDLFAIAMQLKKYPFAAGHVVSSYDATLYSFLFNIMHIPLNTPIRKSASAFTMLSNYLKRIEDIILAKATYHI